MATNLQSKASPWQPNQHMNVTAAPFRPPPFSLSQDPLLAAGLVSQHQHQHGSPSGGLGPIGSVGTSPNPMNSTAHLGAPPSMSLHGPPQHVYHQQHQHGGPMNGPSPAGQQGGQGQGQGQSGAVKYKTELCRNWEATGHCAYRGCTYAHGYEDLRAVQGGPQGAGGTPMMMTQQMMPMPQGHSATGSPQQHTYSFTANVVNAAAAMCVPPTGPSASGVSSAMGTPVAGTYRIGGGVGLVGPGGLGGGLGAPIGGPSGLGGASPIPSAPAPIQATLGVPPPISATAPAGPTEHLMDLIMLEVRAERDKLFSQQTANRQLEQQLKREQLMRQRNVNNTTVIAGAIAAVEEAIRRRHAVLTDLKRACGEDTMEAAIDAMLDDYSV